MIPSDPELVDALTPAARSRVRRQRDPERPIRRYCACCDYCRGRGCRYCPPVELVDDRLVCRRGGRPRAA